MEPRPRRSGPGFGPASAAGPSWRRGWRAWTRCRASWPRRCAGSRRARSNEGSLESLAGELGVTSRHLRRAMQAALGVSPVELAQSRRLALARQLVADTTLPLAEVAFASGFRSVRRFNAAFRARYDCAPSRLRRARRPAAPADTLTLPLDYRPPYDWPALLALPRRARHPRRRAGARRRLPPHRARRRPDAAGSPSRRVAGRAAPARGDLRCRCRAR